MYFGFSQEPEVWLNLTSQLEVLWPPLKLAYLFPYRQAAAAAKLLFLCCLVQRHASLPFYHWELGWKVEVNSRICWSWSISTSRVFAFYTAIQI